MLIQTESKAQGWRAVAVFDDRDDALIFVGRSSTQVRQEFTEAFLELYDDEEREHVTSIQLQQWNGAPDAGRLYVANANELNVRFRLETLSEIAAQPAYRKPYVFGATMSGEVFAMDEGSGARRWKYATGFSVTRAPASLSICSIKCTWRHVSAPRSPVLS